MRFCVVDDRAQLKLTNKPALELFKWIFLDNSFRPLLSDTLRATSLCTRSAWKPRHGRAGACMLMRGQSSVSAAAACSHVAIAMVTPAGWTPLSHPCHYLPSTKKHAPTLITRIIMAHMHYTWFNHHVFGRRTPVHFLRLMGVWCIMACHCRDFLTMREKNRMLGLIKLSWVWSQKGRKRVRFSTEYSRNLWDSETSGFSSSQHLLLI